MVATYLIGMPLLTAGMTLVPSARPTSIAPCPTSVMRSGVDLVLERDVEAGLLVVAGLVGEVERRELDARDEAEARRSAPSAPGSAPWLAARRSARGPMAVGTDAGSGCRRPARQADASRRSTTSAAAETRDRDGDGDTDDLHGHGSTVSGRRRGGARRGRRGGTARSPAARCVRSVANISGMSNSDPRARLMSTPRPRSAPAHSPTIAPTTASVTPTRMPAEDARQRRRDLERRQDLTAGRPQRRDRARAAGRRRTGSRPSSRPRPGRTRSASRSRPCRPAPARTTARSAGRGPGSAWPGRATRYGDSRRSTSALRARRVADESADPAPTAKPRATSPSVASSAAGSCRPPKRRRTSAQRRLPGGGRMNGGKPLDDHDRLPDRDERRASAPTIGSDRPSVMTAAASPRCRRISRAVARDDGRIEVVDRPRSGQLHGHVGDDPCPGAADRTTTRSATRMASAMLWVTSTIVGRGPLPEPEQLEVEALAAQRVERAERLVEQQHPGLEREGSGEGHPLALCRPTARPADWQSRSDRGATSSTSVGEPLGPPLRRPAGELEWVRDVVGGRPPRQQPRLLEHEPDPRVGLGDRVAVEGDGSAVGLGAARRSPAGASTCPQPLGPMRATIPPPGTSRSTPSSTGSRPPPRIGNARSTPSTWRRRRDELSRVRRQQVGRSGRIQAAVDVDTPGRRSRRSSGRGSSRRSMRVIAWMAERDVRAGADRRRPRGSPSRGRPSRGPPGRAPVNPVTSALIWFQRLAARRAAAHAHRGHA